MIDIGAKLTNSSFSTDLPDVIERARSAGIKAILITGTDSKTSLSARAVANDYPKYLYSTAGVHPHDADSYSDADENILNDLLAHSNVVAVGETGLDFNRNYSTPSNQLTAFEAQLALAHCHKKPLFLHERDAFKALYGVLRGNRDSFSNAVIHCFTGDRAALRAYLDLGLFIGITGWICDKKRGELLRDIIRYAPIDRLMIETDAPYLTPHRGKLKSQLAQKNRNEPWTLRYTAAALANALSLDTETLIAATSQNACRFFNLTK